MRKAGFFEGQHKRTAILVAGGIGIFLVMLGGIAGAVVGQHGAGKQVSRNDVGTEVGQRAPQFRVTTIDGTTLTSDELRGKVVVITSAAAWCPTCAMEAREFRPVYEVWKDEGVIFLTVDIDPRDTPAFIREFASTLKPPWWYADTRGGKELINRFRLRRFEITYVLDREGIVRYQDYGVTSSATLLRVLEGIAKEHLLVE